MCRISSSFIAQAMIHDSSWLDCYHGACDKNIKNNLLKEVIIDDREEFEIEEILNKKNVKNEAWYLIK